MQHPPQTSMLASKLHNSWLWKYFHLVFICFCQINDPLKNNMQRGLKELSWKDPRNQIYLFLHKRPPVDVAGTTNVEIPFS